MIKIGFIGAYDKTDFIVQIAKLITSVGKKVLVIDSTIMQKAKYIIPVINPTKTYITEFEEIDVAVGFKKFEQIYEYLGTEVDIDQDYDYVLIDIDDSNCFDDFNMRSARINYFVTSFDLYSLKRGLEILSGLQEPQRMKKIIFSNRMSKEEDEYLNFLSSNYKIQWNEEKIYFPLEQGDQTAIIDNQRAAKVKFKNLTQNYRENLLYMTEQILGNNSINTLRKNMRNIDKGV